MKKLGFIIILISVIATAYSQNSSCKDFALKKESEIFADNDFISDGHYYAAQLQPGDFSQIYKPFYRGKTYKIVAIAKENLPGLTITVQDFRNQVLYQNSEIKHQQEWVFQPQRSQNLKIKISVPKSKDPAQNMIKDCVVVFIGFK